MTAAFLSGLFFGVFLGVIVLAIVSINRSQHDLDTAEDAERLNFIEDYCTGLTFFGDHWVVLKGKSPIVVGEMRTNIRESIDSARMAMEVERG